MYNCGFSKTAKCLRLFDISMMKYHTRSTLTGLILNIIAVCKHVHQIQSYLLTTALSILLVDVYFRATKASLGFLIIVQRLAA